MIKRRDYQEITLDGKEFAYMEFGNMADYFDVIEKNGWQYSRYSDKPDSYARKWAYGSSFPSKGEHRKALLIGKATERCINTFKKMKASIDQGLNVSQFYRKGLSCKRNRRFMDEGDEIDIDRFLGNADNVWTSYKRDKKAKNIKIALNFGLACTNSEENFAELVAVLSTVSDLLTQLGYATEVLGCNARRYSGRRNYYQTCSSIKFKRSGERLDIQRLLSMGLQGLLRDLEFGVGEMLEYDGSQGQQTLMAPELREMLNINYVIEQKGIKTDQQKMDFFEGVIKDLVEKRSFL